MSIPVPVFVAGAFVAGFVGALLGNMLVYWAHEYRMMRGPLFTLRQRVLFSPSLDAMRGARDGVDAIKAMLDKNP